MNLTPRMSETRFRQARRVERYGATALNAASAVVKRCGE